MRTRRTIVMVLALMLVGTAGTHAHFQTPLPASPGYRVRVFAFSLENSGGPR